MIGRKIIFKDVINSTNNYVANLVLAGEMDHGTVILADHQTDGKGQREAVWESEPYLNLIFSTWIKHENMAVNRQIALSQLVSLAIVDLLKHFGISAVIKWPNDILIGSSKIAGVLIENQIGQIGLKSSIIGIGMNLNQNKFENFNATSLSIELNRMVDVKEVAFQLIEKLNQRYLQFKQNEIEDLNLAYHDKLWLKGIESQFSDLNGIFEGYIHGVDDQGRLIVEVQGELKYFQHKEIVFLERKMK